jgi:hypothetical protein
VAAARYVTPLREGGSLPAIVEADDGRLYVVKFRGAGQGSRALVAEVIAGELGRALGLRVPALALVELDPALARTERDPEIQHLLRASAGLNLGLAYVPGAVGFDPAARVAIAGALASRIVIFDAFVTNVDRTARNPNLLWAEGELWLIDHGSALYWHHDWSGALEGSARPFPLIRDHVLLPWADDLPAAGEALRRKLGDEVIERAVAAVPDEWLPAEAPFESPAARRAAYVAYLRARREATPIFLEEAIRARAHRL